MKKIHKKLLKPLLALFFFLGCFFNAHSQVLLADANMESNAGWTVYYGTASHATYQFNYTSAIPANGQGGCLRVTSLASTNTLFWQKIKLKGGKKYIVDGAVKTSNVVNFFCEYYLSTVAPTADVDYSPNSNADVILGLSTWAGCGANLNALMSVVACTGKTSFLCPGTIGTDVDVYFAVKTGTFSTIFTEVLIDQVSVKEVDDSRLLSTDYGTIDQTALTISDISPSITAEKFRNGLTAFSNSTITLLGIGDTIFNIAYMDMFYISYVKKVKVTGNVGTSIYSLNLRSLSADDTITSTSMGVLDNSAKSITTLPFNAKAIQLKTAVIIPVNATFAVVNASNVAIANNALLISGYKAEVKAENGAKKYYTLEIGSDSIMVESFTDYQTTISGLTNKIWELNGHSEINITGRRNPLSGSTLNLRSENIWVYFDSIKPQEVSDKYLSHIMVNGNAAVNSSNIQLVQYYNGSVVISQPFSYKPLVINSADSLTGSSMELGLYTYYRASQLGTMNNNIKSFLLKKGYMATFAMDELGTGYSKVYMAIDSDIVVNMLPLGLYGKVSFIRVVPWRWITKKGWCGGSKQAADMLNCTWQYDWDNVANSTLNVEYIPMRHNRNWNAYDNINNKQNTTHSLGFNEPDRVDQANMPVSEAITLWPEMLKSGLRLGSPSPSDGGVNWLFDFIAQCDLLNYRVDYIAMHWYMGGQTARQFYDRLKWIHDVTKRPIWITEWNNGANWTSAANGKPTYESQARTISQYLYMLDTTSFVERYSIYEWVEDTRQMYYSGSSVLTPAGKVYRDKVSPKAYNSSMNYAPAFVMLPSAPINPQPIHNSLKVGVDTILTWENGSPEIPASSYKVYFGTVNPPPLVGSVTEAKYKPATLLPNKVYYWKITTVAGSGEKSGTLWAFLTANVTGLDNVKKEGSINFFPNPAKEILHIQGIQSEEMFDIFNLLGDKVFSGKVTPSINVSFLPVGIYTIRIYSSNTNTILKFIKE